MNVIIQQFDILLQALMIHFQSYMNGVEMVLAVDEESIPNPHQQCQDLVDAVALIKDAVTQNNL